jgi:general secretion pathway protein D
MNFRGVPLETVLDYLSEAAGFVIVRQTEVKGKVDVWSHQPLTKDEAVDLLNSILNQNGYAAIRNGKTLVITTRDEAKKRDIPVRVLVSTNDPTVIPKNDEMVTQIIPVRYANAVQMTRDLQPLLPSYATLTANESGNALVLTDTQASIRRMAEIVRALDTSIASISAIRVFPLRFADAKELATVLKELFEPPASSQRNQGGARGQIQQFLNRGGGGFPGGGFPGGGEGGGGGGRGGGGASSGTGVSEARNAASRVVAVADERTNSLVVSAPDEYIPTIETLVKEIDKVVDDVTELRVFHLKYSNPIEMADILMELFPDDTQSQGSQAAQFRGQFGFPGGGQGGGGRRGGNNQQDTSERMKKMGKVVAVPDERTGSVIVSAASEIMSQIAEMITQLDSNPARKQKVFVYSLENADVQNVEQVLRNMFEGQNSRNVRNNSGLNNQNNNPLNNRNNSNQGNNNTGLGQNRAFGGNQTTR